MSGDICILAKALHWSNLILFLDSHFGSPKISVICRYDLLLSSTFLFNNKMNSRADAKNGSRNNFA